MEKNTFLNHFCLAFSHVSLQAQPAPDALNASEASDCDVEPLGICKRTFQLLCPFLGDEFQLRDVFFLRIVSFAYHKTLLGICSFLCFQFPVHDGMGVAFAPTEGGGRGAADPRVGANVTRSRFAWQAQ